MCNLKLHFSKIYYLYLVILAGIIESVHSGGVRPDTHFPNVLDRCYSYSPRRCRTGRKKCVAIPRISCERRTSPLRTDSIIPAIVMIPGKVKNGSLTDKNAPIRVKN